MCLSDQLIVSPLCILKGFSQLIYLGKEADKVGASPSHFTQGVSLSPPKQQVKSTSTKLRTCLCDDYNNQIENKPDARITPF
jgi:hypothetical protein